MSGLICPPDFSFYPGIKKASARYGAEAYHDCVLPDMLADMVANDVAGAQIEDLLANINAEVGNAFQIACEPQAIDEVACVRRSSFQSLSGGNFMLVPQGIYCIVFGDDGMSQRNIRRNNKPQGILQHREHELAHGGEITRSGGLWGVGCGSVNGSFRNMTGEIRHAFQRDVHFDAGDDNTQISSHGLVECQDFEALFLQPNFLAINDGIVCDDLACELLIRRLKGGERLLNGVVDKCALSLNLQEETMQFVGEVFFHVLCRVGV